LNRVVLDTGVLLELTIVEASLGPGQVHRSLHQRLKTLLGAITNRTRYLQFTDRLKERFGETSYSAGSLIELERLILGELRTSRQSAAEFLTAFWEAFHILCERFRVIERPFDGPTAEPPSTFANLITFGPVDAHLLRILKDEGQTRLATLDGTLEAEALALNERGVFRVWDALGP
jgi:hypothetical protein